MSSETLFPGQDATVEQCAKGASDRVLLLAPSRGLGGGIERYLQTVQSAFEDARVVSCRLDLARPGLAGHRTLLAEAVADLDGTTRPTRLVIGHQALLPVGAVLARMRPVNGISVICHGREVWGKRWGPRDNLEHLLMHRRDVRLVAVSSFTAGTLLRRGRATILPPGLSRTWFSELVSAADLRSATSGGSERPHLEVMTAFRLSEWRDKGLPQLMDALGALGRADIRLTVCGSGTPSAALLAYLGRHPWCRLRHGLTDAELAAQYAKSVLFVLATRTRSGRRPTGEGFGLVLLEAQVAGTAVIGPAHGGSPAAYLEGVTGSTPRDEGAAALTRVLDELTRQPGRLREMGSQGAVLARARFDPDRYATMAADRLL